jgi:hypothetical protein
MSSMSWSFAATSPDGVEATVVTVPSGDAETLEAASEIALGCLPRGWSIELLEPSPPSAPRDY